MAEDDLPEPDRIEGAPHPRETERLIQDGMASADEGAAIEEGVVRQLTGLKGGIGRVQEVMVEIVAASRSNAVVRSVRS